MRRVGNHSKNTSAFLGTYQQRQSFFKPSATRVTGHSCDRSCSKTSTIALIVGTPMTEGSRVGVRQLYPRILPDTLKQQCLFFDQILIPDLPKVVNTLYKDDSALQADLEWLGGIRTAPRGAGQRPSRGGLILTWTSFKLKPKLERLKARGRMPLIRLISNSIA